MVFKYKFKLQPAPCHKPLLIMKLSFPFFSKQSLSKTMKPTTFPPEVLIQIVHKLPMETILSLLEISSIRQQILPFINVFYLQSSSQLLEKKYPYNTDLLRKFSKIPGIKIFNLILEEYYELKDEFISNCSFLNLELFFVMDVMHNSLSFRITPNSTTKQIYHRNSGEEDLQALENDEEETDLSCFIRGIDQRLNPYRIITKEEFGVDGYKYDVNDRYSLYKHQVEDEEWYRTSRICWQPTKVIKFNLANLKHVYLGDGLVFTPSLFFLKDIKTMELKEIFNLENGKFFGLNKIGKLKLIDGDGITAFDFRSLECQEFEISGLIQFKNKCKYINFKRNGIKEIKIVKCGDGLEIVVRDFNPNHKELKGYLKERFISSSSYQVNLIDVFHKKTCYNSNELFRKLFRKIELFEIDIDISNEDSRLNCIDELGLFRISSGSLAVLNILYTNGEISKDQTLKIFTNYPALKNLFIKNCSAVEMADIDSDERLRYGHDLKYLSINVAKKCVLENVILKNLKECHITGILSYNNLKDGRLKRVLKQQAEVYTGCGGGETDGYFLNGVTNNEELDKIEKIHKWAKFHMSLGDRIELMKEWSEIQPCEINLSGFQISEILCMNKIVITNFQLDGGAGANLGCKLFDKFSINTGILFNKCSMDSYKSLFMYGCSIKDCVFTKELRQDPYHEDDQTEEVTDGEYHWNNPFPSSQFHILVFQKMRYFRFYESFYNLEGGYFMENRPGGSTRTTVSHLFKFCQ